MHIRQTYSRTVQHEKVERERSAHSSINADAVYANNRKQTPTLARVAPNVMVMFHTHRHKLVPEKLPPDIDARERGRSEELATILGVTIGGQLLWADHVMVILKCHRLVGCVARTCIGICFPFTAVHKVGLDGSTERLR